MKPIVLAIAGTSLLFLIFSKPAPAKQAANGNKNYSVMRK
jgi:hypothetical protein